MTEEQIIAFVDGELGPIEALRFERAIAADPALAAAVDRHRRLRTRIAEHYAPIAREPLPGKLTSMLDRDDKVVALSPGRRGWFGRGRGYAALAASLVAGLALGQLLPFRPSAPLGEAGGVVVARGALAEALETQLASTGQTGPYHIMVSFRSGDDRYCRSFASSAGAGIGCRDDGGWTLERFVAGAPPTTTGAYRQAGNASADIFAAAQEMMKGDPLDAAGERAARARGWR